MMKVSVCGGLGCRMFGSEDTFQEFQQELARRGLTDRVELYQTFCMAECSQGPCVRVDGVKFRHVAPDKVPELIENEVLPRLA